MSSIWGGGGLHCHQSGLRGGRDWQRPHKQRVAPQAGKGVLKAGLGPPGRGTHISQHLFFRAERSTQRDRETDPLLPAIAGQHPLTRTEYLRWRQARRGLGCRFPFTCFTVVFVLPSDSLGGGLLVWNSKLLSATLGISVPTGPPRWGRTPGDTVCRAWAYRNAAAPALPRELAQRHGDRGWRTAAGTAGARLRRGHLAQENRACGARPGPRGAALRAHCSSYRRRGPGFTFPANGHQN